MKKLLCLVFFLSINASAQQDPIAAARQLAIGGHRAEAIRMLEQRLSARPDDVDARTLLGIVLSWDGQYGRAREELRRVLANDPKNVDTQQALQRIDLWTHRAMNKGSELIIRANYYDYENSDPWREGYASLKIENRFAPVVVRAAKAKRFRLNDAQFELEAYPKFGARTYAYLSVGYSPDAVSSGWEVSARLQRGRNEVGPVDGALLLRRGRTVRRAARRPRFVA